ncbi:Flavin-containing monooxygenase FMO GS-OX3 [Penicillium chrysogenum]|nr:Flavin-containing monooxygenase FMO GS-OX3 [Penicillium chrysogenum]
MSRTLSPRKKPVQSVTSDYPWRSDNPFGPPQIQRSVPSGIKRLRDTLSKLSPSAIAEKDLIRKKNQYKTPLTERNVDTLVTEQECNAAYKPNLHSPEIQVTEWLQRVSPELPSSTGKLNPGSKAFFRGQKPRHGCSMGNSNPVEVMLGVNVMIRCPRAYHLQRMSKKVAIIGAGPSGLVTAKTLLHNFPGTFSPIIFDSQTKVGGLWSSHLHPPNQVNGPPVTLDPRMRTNLSRFTVAFSDLAWESVIPDADIPIFPQARQVGEYLACYAERYIPTHVLRLGCRVIRTIRKVEDEDDPKWNVQWVQGSAEDDGVSSEDFDLIVIASGYFAQQYIPDIPGRKQFQGRIIHSSSLHYEGEQLLFNETKDANDQIVVIGGSMSGVEAASAVALRQSSTLSTNRIPHTQETKVHHIHSRPFWALPTYLPHESPDGSPSFLPLDLAMYDLGRRPPGPIDYALGPIPEEKAVKTNSYFRSLLGSEYEKYAHMHSHNAEQSRTQPPWVAIGNEYAEFVRCGAIQPSMGRVTSVNPDPDTKKASVQYEGPDGKMKTIDNVAAIVMATGFMPYKSLSLLPDEVLTTLEYSKTDPFSPLILDKGGTVRSEIPDVGFVGFYRGPYWGVMEMQARFLGKLWGGQNGMVCETDNQKQSLRSLRLAHSDLARGQFPMGDYVGLMESFAKDLDISRSALESDDGRSGPAVPARYLYGDVPTPGIESEADRTLRALRDALLPGHETAQKAAASAIFRALHGTWKYSVQTHGI